MARISRPLILISKTEDEKFAINKKGVYRVESLHDIKGSWLEYPPTITSLLKGSSVKFVFEGDKTRWCIVHLEKDGIFKSCAQTFESCLHATKILMGKTKATLSDNRGHFNIEGRSLISLVKGFAENNEISLPLPTEKVVPPASITEPVAGIVSFRGAASVATPITESNEESNYKLQAIYDELLGDRDHASFKASELNLLGKQTYYFVRIILNNGKKHIMKTVDKSVYNYMRLGRTRDQRLAAIRNSK